MANSLSFNRLDLLEIFIHNLLVQLTTEFTEDGKILL